MFARPAMRLKLGETRPVQGEWAAKNPRGTVKAPITVADVLNSRMIAPPVPIAGRAGDQGLCPGPAGRARCRSRGVARRTRRAG